ncbi:MAG: lanthionine synthetase LanC family protein [Thermoanaerobaculia bacterium]
MHEIFGAYLEDYLAAARLRSWVDLPRQQQGLYGSLAFGAAGIAYAHWYAGYLTGNEALLDQAGRWVRGALAGQRNRLAFLGPAAPPGARMPAGAYLYGLGGVHFVHALIARAREDRRAERRALGRFAELSRASTEGPSDLYMGSAGCLAATAILLRHLKEERLLDVGAALAGHLVQHALPDRQGGMHWHDLHGLGLAHGTAGALLALLLWSAAAGSPPPPWFVPSLAALLDTALHSPERFTRLARHRSRLCGGVMGSTFLAVRAAQVLREPSLLASARETAALALAHLPSAPDLCCGRAGCAFALLALAEQDPGGPWRNLAHELALSTLLCERAEWPFIGLYGGEAAIPCLALNIRLGIDSGPPCLDFIAPRQAGSGSPG